jgi:hypothetical protein
VTNILVDVAIIFLTLAIWELSKRIRKLEQDLRAEREARIEGGWEK